jgi:hypothetical protein
MGSKPWLQTLPGPLSTTRPVSPVANDEASVGKVEMVVVTDQEAPRTRT